MRGTIVFLMVMAAVTASKMDAAGRRQARSMVISERGIVATSQTLASQAGAQILARGGSAVDAAIAANATLGVVEPMMNGMGGDLFAIRRDAATGKVAGINASGWAPRALTRELMIGKGYSTMPEDGILSPTVPGCVAGWQALHRKYGRLAWADLFQPAIYYAEHGFPVTEWIHGYWSGAATKLGKAKEASRIFLPGGRTPEVGEVFRNPELAKALRLVAWRGADAFYRGEIADAIVATSQRLGGVFAPEDLAEYEPEWVEPIRTGYRGWKVYELPPNGQGMAALEMLNLMERFELGRYDAASPEALHREIEAQKLAYQDLNRYLGDPKFSRIPFPELISKPYAERRAGLIDLEKANCDVAPGNPLASSGDTIYLSVIDRDGNIVSLIQSLYLSFGSGVVVEGYGFHLQNRGSLFSLEEGSPNVLEPRKRPFHTIIPGLMEKGDVAIGFGIMGGLNQAQAHAQFVSNLVDHGMNIQLALEAPRFTKLDFGGCDVQVERRVPAATIERLRKLGHRVKVLDDFASPMGGGQAVLFNRKTGVKFGASSPRKDGAAVPEPDDYFGSGR